MSLKTGGKRGRYTGNNELLASKVRATKAWRAAKKDIPDLGTVKI
jgi:hypothetical protein